MQAALPDDAPSHHAHTATAGHLYDALRDVHYVKPLLRGWLHLIWFVVSIGFGSLLVRQADTPRATTAAVIYVVSLVGLFGTSALYHRGTWTPEWSCRLQRLDHTMIFLLIAGSATPAFLVAAKGTFGAACFTLMWALTLVACVIHLFWMQAPERLVGAVFIALGAVAGLSLPAVWVHTGVVAATLFLAGGLLYIVGALSYHRRWPDPVPAVFGYHEVFHAHVCAAATCHFIAIAAVIG